MKICMIQTDMLAVGTMAIFLGFWLMRLAITLNISNNYSKYVEGYFVGWGAISNRNGKFNWSYVNNNKCEWTGYDFNGNQTKYYPTSVIQTHGWSQTYIENNIISNIGCASQYGENKGIILDYVGSKTLYGCDHLIIRNNVISGNKNGNGSFAKAGAIHSYTGKYNKIYNNICYDDKSGITIETEYSQNNLIYNNTVDDNNYGIYYSNGGTNNVFRNNIITNSAILGLYDSGNIIDDHTLFNNNSVDYKITNQPSNVFGNPNYKDQANHDYSILSRSAAIDKGTTSGLGTLIDYYGNTISDIPDIGAFQYSSNNNSSQLPSTPVLSSPVNSATNISTSPVLSWNSSNYANSYRIQISLSSDFTTILIDKGNIPSTSIQISNLETDNVYYWRVSANNSSGTSNWSKAYRFFTSGTSTEISGNILLSTENGTLQNGATLKTASGSIGSKVVYCTSTNSTVKFNVNIPSSGTWYAWGRFYFTDGNHDSFRIQIDDGAIYTFGNSTPWNQWTWQANGLSNLSLGYLSSGQHTVTIMGREVSSNTLIDQLLLTQDPNTSVNDNNLGLGSSGNGNILLSVENGTLQNGATLKSATGSNGAQVGYCISLNSSIKFNISIPASGNWYVWGRFYFLDGNHDSFRIQIDNGTIYTFGNSTPWNQWTWQGNGLNYLSLGYLSSGQHTLTIMGREYGSNTLVDQVFLTQDQNAKVDDSNLGLSPNGNGNILLSAQNGTLQNGATLKSASGSIGTQVAYCISSNSSIKFDITIPVSGTWYIWGRFYFLDGNHDSFRIQVDDGSIYTFGNSTPWNQWTWEANGFSNLSVGNLSSGQHTITVLGREFGTSTLIDQVLLTQDPNFNRTDQSLNLSKEDNNNVVDVKLSKYELSQNYPNPFNPTTIINYSIPKDGLVSIKVYDILGKEIKSLVNEFKSAGTYTVQFNGSNLASGIYFYKIDATNFSDIKKMILVK